MSDIKLEKVLILDDNSDYRKLIKTFIDKLLPGVETIEYDPVFEGIPGDSFNWSEIDVLLLDYHLSIVGTTGLDILHKHHKKNSFPATIMLTGAGTEEIAIRALKSGIYEYQPKQSLTKDKLKQSIIHAWEEKKSERKKKQEITQHNRSFSKEIFYETLEKTFGQKESERALVIIKPDNIDLLEEEIGIIGRDNLVNHIAKNSFEVFKLGACNPNITRISDTEIGVQIDYPINKETLEFNMQGLCKHLAKCTFKFSEEKYKFSVSIGVLKLGVFNVPAEQLIYIASTACQHASKTEGNSHYIWKETDAAPELDKQPTDKETVLKAIEEKENIKTELKAADAEKKKIETIIQSEKKAKEKLEAELKIAAEAKEKAEAEAKTLAEKEVRRNVESEFKAQEEAKLKIERETKARDQALLRADQEAQHRVEAELKIEEAEKAKDQAVLRADQEAQHRVEAELKIEEAAKAKDQAVLRADQETQHRVEVELKIEEAAKAKDQAVLRADQETQHRVEAELKIEEAAKAKDQAVLRADQEAKEKAEAELKAMTEEKAKFEAELRAEHETQQRIEAELKTESETEAKLQAEQEMKLAKEAKEKLEAELKAITESKEKAEKEMEQAKEAKEKLEAELKAITESRKKAEEKIKITGSNLDATNNTAEHIGTSKNSTSKKQEETNEIQESESKDIKTSETLIQEAEEKIKKLIDEKRIIQTYQAVTAMFEDENEIKEIYKTGLQAIVVDDKLNKYLSDTSVFSTSLQQIINEWVLRQIFLRITESGTEKCQYLFLINVSESWFSDITLFNWLQKILLQTKKYNPGKSIILEVPLDIFNKHKKRAQALIGTLHKSHQFSVALSNIDTLDNIVENCVLSSSSLLMMNIEQLQKLTGTLAPHSKEENAKESEENKEDDEETSKQNMLQYLKSKGIRIITSGIEDSTLLMEAITAGTDYTLGNFVGEIQDNLVETSTVESFELT